MAKKTASATDPHDLTVADLTPDPSNRRRHGARNVEMLTTALQAVGAARSIVIDEDNGVLAGNGLIEAAAAAGLTRVKVIDADGQTIIAVRRTGLTPEQKTALALYDNRTAELAEWNMEQLAADVAGGVDLAPFFSQNEIAKLLQPAAPSSFATVDINVTTTYCCPSCGYRWSGNPKPNADADDAAAAPGAK